MQIGVKYKSTRHGDGFRELLRRQLELISANKEVTSSADLYTIDNLYELDNIKDETWKICAQLQHDRDITDYYYKLEMFIADMFYHHIKN